MSEPTDFIRITNREIYEMVVSTRDTVKSMDSRMNAILNENADLRKRVRALELKVYAGLAGVVAAIPVMARMGGIL